LSKINASQIVARNPTHKGKVLSFDATTGEATFELITSDLLDPGVTAAISGTAELDNWALDAGSQPVPIQIGNFVVDSFDSNTEIAIYTEETLGVTHDPTKAISFRYQYSMGGTSTDQVDISLGYQLRGNSFSPAQGYIEVADSFTPEGDTDVHTRTIVIPAQPSVTDERPIISLRLRRLGDTDANLEDFNLFSTIIYQD